MLYEIVSTRAERGILKGTSGFCPVAISEKTPKEFIKPLFGIAKRQAAEASNLRKNASNFYSHFPLTIKGKSLNVVTRGTRVREGESPEYIVHQLLFEPDRLVTAGPCAIFYDDSKWFTAWGAAPQVLKQRTIELPPLSPKICKYWEKFTGDAGWASAPYEAWENSKACNILTQEDMDIRDIVSLAMEAQSLIHHEKRWKIPIVIGAWHPFKKDSRFWSVFDSNTQAAVDSMHSPNTLRLDLSGRLNRSGGKYSERARSGQWIGTSSFAKPLPNDPSASGFLREQASQSGIRLDEQSESVQVTSSRSGLKLRPANETIASAAAPEREDESLEELTTQDMADPKEVEEEAKARKAAAMSRFTKQLLINRRNKKIKIGLLAFGGLGLLIFAGLSYGVWRYVVNLVESRGDDQPMVRVVDTTVAEEESPASASNDAAPAKRERIDAKTSNNSASSSPTPETPVVTNPSPATESTPKSPKEPGIAPQIVADALEAISSDIVAVDLRISEENNSKKLLFTLPFPTDEICKELSIEMITAGRVQELSFDGDKNSWSLKDDEDSQSIAEISSENESDESRFLWQWMSEVSEESAQRVLAGSLRIGVASNDSLSNLTISAFPPLIHDGIQIDSAAISNPTITPPMTDYLMSAPIAKKYDWETTNLSVAAIEEQIWTQQAWDATSNSSLFLLDSDFVREQVAERTKLDPKDAELIATVNSIFRFYGPFGVRIGCELEPDLDGKTLVPKIQFGAVLVAVNGNIILSRKPNIKVSEGKYRKAQKELLVNGLLEKLDLSGEKEKRIIERKGRGADEASTPSQRARLAIGGIMYAEVSKLIGSKLNLEITRTSRINGSRVVATKLPKPNSSFTTAQPDDTPVNDESN